MTLRDLPRKTERSVKRNSPTILTGIGVSGVLVTAYLAGKASWEASQVIQIEELNSGTDSEWKNRYKSRSKHVWKLYIPAAISGAVTIGCIVGGAKISSRRAAAAYALTAIAERGFEEYREKVVEKIGEKKEQSIRDEIAQDRVDKNPPPTVITLGTGTVLCCEMHTMRYFMCEIEKIKRAEMYINRKILREMEATLDDFYHEVGIPGTSFSHLYGWDTGRMLTLEPSAIMGPDGTPAWAFEYDHLKQLRT